ncbi:MAG: NAD-dependent protein deacylase [Clostridiaceae bacterium]|jgi:NAD-dependent deacetylase|nr:NAD-dependent protein deacylase [Clostridiaceae bacterium]
MDISKIKRIIEDSDNIVFFGGAGVSTESNIPDFRSATGLYNSKSKSTYSPEEILSHDFFISHTKEFYDFYKSKMIYRDAKPNKAHLALAKLEASGKLKAVITQNIDGLHQMAGSKKVLELHGSIHRNYCMKCSSFFDLDYVINSEGIPVCDKCEGIVKPDVVLYQENLDSRVIDEAVKWIFSSDVFIIGGTSLTVYPAAGLVNYYRGSKLILINRTKTTFDNKANYVHFGSIGEFLSQVVDLS